MKEAALDPAGRVAGPVPSPGALAGARLQSRLWHGLTRPWLLLLSGVSALAMLAGGWFLPQVPGQLRDEPAAAARWLAATSASYGATGSALAPVGLFDVLRSPLLHVLLATTSFLLFVHLADQMAAVLLVRRLQQRLTDPAEPGEPLPIPSPHPVFRLRYARPEPPAEAARAVEGQVAGSFESVQRASPQQAGVPLPEGARQGDSSVHLLALRNSWASDLRTLCVCGLLLALLSIWLLVFFGWRLSLAALAPGGSYQYGPRDVDLRYVVDDAGAGGAMPVLVAQIGDDTGQAAVVDDQRLRVGDVDLRAAVDAPSLLVATVDGRAALVRPGQSRGASQTGLVFPTIGSEETLLLPDDGLGLRVVRGPTDAAPYLVEVYRSDDIQPVQRIPLDAAGVQSVQIEDTSITLRFTPLPSLAVTVRYVPAPWIFWIALVLAGVGGIGFLRSPGFLLAQIGPWPEDRSVVVLQSQRNSDLQALRANE